MTDDGEGEKDNGERERERNQRETGAEFRLGGAAFLQRLAAVQFASPNLLGN